MRDYYALISSMVAGLDNNTGAARRAFYSRARSALCEQLRKIEPPLTNSEMTGERLSLEAAIRKFEAEAIRTMRPTPSVGAAAAGPKFDSQPQEYPPRPSTGVGSGAVRAIDPAGQRGKLVKLALLAQIIEARDPRIRKPRGIPRAGEGSNFLHTPQQHRAPPSQRVPVPVEIPQLTAVQDLLANLIEARQGGADSRLRKSSLLDTVRTAEWTVPLFGILYFLFGFAQLVAFFRGLQTGFELGGVASIGVFVLLYLTGSAGSIPMAIVSFYGAWRGWYWPIWGAGLLAFPFVVLSFALLGIGGFYSFFNRQKIPPIVQVIGSLSESPRWREGARRWRTTWARLLWNHPTPPSRRPRRPRSRR